MLLGDFYTYKIIDKKEGEFSASIQLNKNHSIYKGHFPKIPILPGVCQVQILKETLCDVLGLTLKIDNARDIKFLTMLNPSETEDFQINVVYDNNEENIFKVTSVFFKEEVKYFKFKGELIKTGNF
ncbi:MAG: 3-hydroxyacyl-ACP dehydratase [Bacteroidota bacterium]